MTSNPRDHKTRNSLAQSLGLTVLTKLITFPTIELILGPLEQKKINLHHTTVKTKVLQQLHEWIISQLQPSEEEDDCDVMVLLQKYVISQYQFIEGATLTKFELLKMLRIKLRNDLIKLNRELRDAAAGDGDDEG